MGLRGVAIQSFMKSPSRVLHTLIKPLILGHLHKVFLLLPLLIKFSNHLTSSMQVTPPALTILFKMLREDSRPLPVGSFTERSVARRVYNSTGVAVEQVTMITPTDALIEFAPGMLVVAIAQVLHQINEWEDIPVWVTCLMGSKNYIMQLCRE